MTTTIAIARKQTILLVKETTRGTLAFPATDGSAVVTIAAGAGSMNQNPNFTNSQEIRNSRDVLDRFLDARPAGQWSFPTYMRPSGAAGDEPQDDVLYECLFGTKTVNAGTSVVYSQALTKDSFSMWMKKDHTVFFAKGCVASQLGLNITNEGGVMQNWQGGLMWMGWCGTDAMASAASQTDTEITVDDAKKFSVGGRIYNSTTDDDNSSAGYEITVVNVSTNTLTIGTGIADSGGWSEDDVIAPFLPSTTEVGEALANRLTTVDFGSDTSKKVQSMDLTLGDPVQYIEDEISTDGYPTDYLEQERNYAGTVNLYYRQADAKYFYDGFDDTEIDVSVNFGSTAGSQAELNMPQTSIEVPEVSTNAPAVNMAIGLMALGSSGEDSATLTFT